jgi:hypothetical protein
MKIILLNGPPRCGKDTAADAIINMPFARAEHDTRLKWGMSYPLKRATHELYGHANAAPDAFEHSKDEPSAAFMGMSPRAAYIAMSEQHAKKQHGDNFFGHVWKRVIFQETLDAKSALVVAPDAGFAKEWDTPLATFGAGRFLLVRIHRPGVTFKGDSRGYIELPGVASIDLKNDGDRGVWVDRVTRVATYWLKNGHVYPEDIC